jgi:hypothetical protein
MNAEMILADAQVLGMVLSFMLLLKVRRLSMGLWSTGPSYQCLPTGSGVEPPANTGQIFRA